MKKVNFKVLFSYIFLLALIFFNSCAIEDDVKLPIFKGINADNNTIFLADFTTDENHKIDAIDTLNNKVIYTYNFNGNLLYDMAYDEYLGNDIFLDLNMSFYMLKTATGKLIKIDIFSFD